VQRESEIACTTSAGGGITHLLHVARRDLWVHDALRICASVDIHLGTCAPAFRAALPRALRSATAPTICGPASEGAPCDGRVLQASV
jgi:hypothetical protein